MKRKARFLHKWIGLFCFVFILVVSLTAIALNHQDIYAKYFMSNEQKVFNESNIETFSVNPFNRNHIVASDFKGLFESRDNGKTWEEIKLFVPSEKINNISFSPTKEDYFAISIKNAGIYYTDDGGFVWDEIKLPFNPATGEYIENLSLGKQTLLINTKFAIYNFNFETGNWDINKFKNIDKKSILNVNEIIYNLHTGKIFGENGKYIYDVISIGLILLSFSGILLSMKPRKKKKYTKVSETQPLVQHEEKVYYN